MPVNRVSRALVYVLRVWLFSAALGGLILLNQQSIPAMAEPPGDRFAPGVGSDETNPVVSMSAPSTDFSAEPTEGPPPLHVQFTDESTGDPTGWAWYFGDEDFGLPWTATVPTVWSARQGHTSVVLTDNSIVLMGGFDGSDHLNDVWRSADQGDTWTQMTADAGWTAREDHSSVVLPDGDILLMGGYDGSSQLSDVWRSSDQGATWTQVTASAGWTARQDHSSVVLPDGSVVLMGGYDGTDRLNDVWSWSDGDTAWAQVTADADWEERRHHSSVVLPESGAIVLIGGLGESGEVWRSEDQGQNWTLLPDDGMFGAAADHSSVVLSDGTIIVVDGYYFDPTRVSNAVWRSTDGGTTWQLMAEYAEWQARDDHSSVTLMDDSVVLMGGFVEASTDGFFLNDIWRSIDQGASWTRLCWWDERTGPDSVAMPNGNIVLMGGRYSYFTYVIGFDDVWSSSDSGSTWSQTTASTDSYGQGVLVADGTIVRIGDTNSDVFRSTDEGASWELVTDDPEWTDRTGSASVVLPDGSIVMTGGVDWGAETGLFKRDVWRSTDQGASWTQMTDDAPWAVRWAHTSVALPDNSIVLMGGISYSGPDRVKMKDVWRSTDQGATWTLMTSYAPWSARSHHASVVLPDGSIVLIGGYDGEWLRSDVWRSTDQGATWSRISYGEWSGRAGHTSVVLPDGSIVVMGGHTSDGELNEVLRWETAGSSEQHPSHDYAELGTYSVALQAYNDQGYSSMRKAAYINVTDTPGYWIYLPLCLRNTP